MEQASIGQDDPVAELLALANEAALEEAASVLRPKKSPPQLAAVGLVGGARSRR